MINAVNEHLGKAYKDINVLITGGLGMIGSSIARELVYLGAHVTILDVYFEQYGAFLYPSAVCSTNEVSGCENVFNNRLLLR